MEEENDIDYKDLYNKLERENISLRMYIIKLKNMSGSITSVIHDLFTDPDKVSYMHGVGVFISFILIPILSFILDLKRSGSHER